MHKARIFSKTIYNYRGSQCKVKLPFQDQIKGKVELPSDDYLESNST